MFIVHLILLKIIILSSINYADFIGDVLNPGTLGS